MGLISRSRALLLAVALAAAAGVAQQPASGARVLRCELTGTVDAGSAAYLADCLEKAEKEGFSALLLRIDTPGGSLEATQELVQRFLSAKVPILAWVGPSGARAGSAGVFLVLASHRAAMAEATRIGAAHPVGMGGEDLDQRGKELARKVENDAAALASGIAAQRGRNAGWAERAVRESVSLPAAEAVAQGVVELVAPSEASFLEAVHGQELVSGDLRWTLQTAGAELVQLSPSPAQRLLHGLANPAIAYLLLLIGGIGLAIELSNPGMIFPGLLGLVAMLLSMVALASLPIQTGAVVLVVLGLGMLVAELFVTSGLLGAGGVVLIGLGGVLLVDRVDPSWFSDRPLHVPLSIVAPVALLTGLAMLYLVVKVGQARRLPAQLGPQALVGQQGRALSEVDGRGGEVFVHGERWQAVSDRPLHRDDRVVVRAIDGLTLHVAEAGGS